MINLKQLLESANIGGTMQPVKMTPEQKKQLLEMVNNYNKCGKKLYDYGDVRQVAETLYKVGELGESYALQECNEDVLQVGNVHKDFKEIRKEAAELRKLSNDAWAANEKMKACYENIGMKLERYYDIN